MLLGAPVGQELEGLRGELRQSGYQHGEFNTTCARHGDTTARTRCIVLGLQGRGQRLLEGLEGPAPVRHARGVRCFLLEEGPENPCQGADQRGQVVWGPRMATTGDPYLPKPVGALQDGDERRATHSAGGPCRTVRWQGEEPLGPGGTLLHVVGRAGGRVRPLTAKEVWRAQGGKVEDWSAIAPEGPGRRREEARALRGTARSCPPETARALARYALETEAREQHAGGCHDPDEKAA